MKNELPMFEIEGTAFLVDIDKALFREADNAENIISFSDMDYKGTHYVLNYDDLAKNVPGRYGYTPDPGIKVIIPPIKRLDPDGLSRKYGIPVASLKDKTDFEIMVDQELFAARLAGQLPVVDIAGKDFVFDYDLMELQRGLNNVIRLDDIEDWSVDRELYHTFYNVRTMQLVHMDPAAISEVPQDVVLLEIPYAHRLDPVADARKEGRGLEEMVIKYPIQAKKTVHVIPAEKTNLPYLVASNRQHGLITDEGRQSLARKR